MSAGPSSDPAGGAPLSDLAGLIHPERLSLCFQGYVSPDLAGKIKASKRLRDRVARVIETHHKLAAQSSGLEGLDPEDAAIAAASSDALTQILPRAAGAIYWSGAIAGAVLAADVAALDAELGQELCSYAVKHRDLSGPQRDLPPIGEIKTRIIDTGWHCLSAWCEALDPATAARIRLKLPPNPIFDGALAHEYIEIGPKIIRRAAAM